AVVLFMLYGLSLRPYRTDTPDLVIAVDDSQSMSHVDAASGEEASQVDARVTAAGYSESSRWNQGRTLLLADDWLSQLQSRYRLKGYFVGDSGRAWSGDVKQWSEMLTSAQAKRQSSRLGDALSEIFQQQRGRPTAAVVLLTDGITTEGKSISDAAIVARRRGAPLFVVGLGSRQRQLNLQIEDLDVERAAFVGDPLDFKFRLRASGMEGKNARVTLRKKDDSQILEEKTIAVANDEMTRQVELRYRPTEKGDVTFIVAVEADAEEVDLSDSEATAQVLIRDDAIKVLLVDSQPRFQYRYLKTLFERQLKPASTSERPENAFDLTAILQDADLEYADQDEVASRLFPASQEELFQYDVIVIGDANPAFLSRDNLELLAKFVVEKGGGVIFVAGDQYLPWQYGGTPFASLFPFQLDVSQRPAPPLTEAIPTKLTSLGLSSPPLQVGADASETLRRWNSIEQLYWLAELPKPKPGAQVLAVARDRFDAQGEPLPLLLQQFVGAGKVMFLASDDLWRWRYHDPFWMQTVRYLARATVLGGAWGAELTASRNEYERGEAVRLRVRFFDDRKAPTSDQGVTVMVEQSGGRQRRVSLARTSGSRDTFEAAISDLPEGDYRAWIAEPVMSDAPEQASTRFRIEATAGEMARLAADFAELRTAATAAGGKFYSFAEATQLLKDLPEGRQVRIETLSPIPVWNSWKLATLFVGLIIGEWLLRKRGGML
ncbi:MAG: VWA domain-containing protein, partial [Blastopirellula sp. JB062]